MKKLNLFNRYIRFAQWNCFIFQPINDVTKTLKCFFLVLRKSGYRPWRLIAKRTCILSRFKSSIKVHSSSALLKLHCKARKIKFKISNCFAIALLVLCQRWFYRSTLVFFMEILNSSIHKSWWCHHRVGGIWLAEQESVMLGEFHSNHYITCNYFFKALTGKRDTKKPRSQLTRWNENEGSKNFEEASSHEWKT